MQAPHAPWSQPFFVPVRLELLAQRVEQRDAAVQLQPPRAPVDPQRQIDTQYRRNPCFPSTYLLE